jgi:ammonium transporter, Amt family
MATNAGRRRDLVVLARGLVATALLCIAFGDMALAQDAAPACGGKVLENCAPNSGNGVDADVGCLC